MSTTTVFTTAPAPAPRVFALVTRAMAALGRALIVLTEAQSRSSEIERLSALSDGQLAAMGLSRERIVHHVFRDRIHL